MVEDVHVLEQSSSRGKCVTVVKFKALLLISVNSCGTLYYNI